MPSEHRNEIVVALVGSSGGGVATLRTDPVELLQSIHEELGKIESMRSQPSCVFVLKYALFVSLANGGGMDFADGLIQYATLFAVNCDKQQTQKHHEKIDENHEKKEENISINRHQLEIKAIKYGPLKEVNDLCRELDEQVIGKAILESSVKGLISVSSDPLGVNQHSFEAAAKMSIPCTGSGGSSLASASEKYGINLVGNAGGSVATSIHTKAISFCYALASSYHYKYTPFLPSRNKTFSIKQSPRIKSIFEACLPAFIAVCVMRRIIEMWFVTDISTDSAIAMKEQVWQNQLLWLLEWHVLPSVCCIVSAHTYASEHGSIVMMAATLASVACGGSTIGGLIVGWVISFCTSRSIFACIRFGLPATMTNVVAGGVGGAIGLGLSASRIIKLLSLVTQVLRNVLHAPIPKIAGFHPYGIGFIFGCCFCHGSKVGYYHSLYLPVILVEMERGLPSLWGSVDECTLVLVSAGICAANLIYPMEELNSSSSICKRGLTFNIFCGDFIEVAYPFMERSTITNISAYIASGISTEILYYTKPYDVLSTAYLPVPISIWLAKDWKRLSSAYIAAFSIAFFGSILANIVTRQRKVPLQKEKNQ